MATSFSRSGSSNASLIPQRWSKQDFKSAFADNPLLPFMGKGDNNIIQVDKDFTKEQGDKITFALRALLAGDGQTDDGAYEGNEEAMVFYNMDVRLAERGHSTQLAGSMTEQSAYDNLRNKGRESMREWVSRIQGRDLIDALSGLSACQKFAGQVTGVKAVNAASANIYTINLGTSAVPTKSATDKRFFAGGEVGSSATAATRVADDASITAGMVFGPLVVEYVKRMAEATVDSSGNPITPIRKIKVAGGSYYLLLVDPLCIKSLRGNAAWRADVRYAWERSKGNPIFSGAEYLIDDVIITPCQLLNRRLGAGGVTVDEYFDTTTDPVGNGVTVARSMLLGAQSACLAWGMLPIWEEGFVDWQRSKWGCHSRFIYGIQRSIMNSVPFGSIIVDTAVTAD